MIDDMLLAPHPELHLEAVEIENFRAISSLKLSFPRRLTVLVGDNGAGKTAVLEAIALGTGWREASATDARRVGDQTTKARVVPRFVPPLTGRGPASPVKLRHGRLSHEVRGFVTMFGDERSYAPDKRVASAPSLREWFSALDADEARAVRDRADLGFRHPQLEAVRDAVRALVPGARRVRADGVGGRLLVDLDVDGRTDTFDVFQLSGGMRTMLALAANLTREFVEAGLDRRSDYALVLIDEIDLHLHPRWQAQIVETLLRTFGGAQFIVATHSEEIVASVPTDLITELRRTPDGVTAHALPPLRGARYGDVLQLGMGLPADRPRDAQELLDQYSALVSGGQGETPQARTLRERLERDYPGVAPDLLRADMEIRRRRIDARRGAG